MKTIKMTWVWAVLAASLAGCECSSAMCDAARTGTEGGCCRATGCDEGFTCNEGVCRSCGASSMRCCYPDTTLGTCDPGLRCRPAIDSAPEQCVPCGMLSQACCDGPGMAPCSDGLACAGATPATSSCQPAATVCRAGPVENVGIEDANKCGIRVIPVAGDTWEHRVECASSMLRAGEVVRMSGPVTVDEPTLYTLCISRPGDGRTNWNGGAFGTYEAGVCACGGEDMLLGCTRSPGMCPGS